MTRKQKKLTPRKQAEKKGLRVRSHLSPLIPTLVAGDAHRLRQILTNLISNAVKFTNKGEVSIEATLENQTDRAITIHFRITDSGIGIRQEDIGARQIDFHESPGEGG